MSFSFDLQADGVLLSLDGYNDKLSILANVIATRMRDYKVDEQRFRLIHDQVRRLYCSTSAKEACAHPNSVLPQLKRSYQNFRLEQPYSHVGFDGAYLTQAVAHTVDEKLAALEGASNSTLRTTVKHMLISMVPQRSRRKASRLTRRSSSRACTSSPSCMATWSRTRRSRWLGISRRRSSRRL